MSSFVSTESQTDSSGGWVGWIWEIFCMWCQSLFHTNTVVVFCRQAHTRRLDTAALGSPKGARCVCVHARVHGHLGSFVSPNPFLIKFSSFDLTEAVFSRVFAFPLSPRLLPSFAVPHRACQCVCVHAHVRVRACTCAIQVAAMAPQQLQALLITAPCPRVPIATAVAADRAV